MLILCCRGLDLGRLPNCPQEPYLAACKFSTSAYEPGEALGYLMGDIVEEVTGVLRLSYYNGAKCAGSGKTRTVNIFLQCDMKTGVVSLYM